MTFKKIFIEKEIHKISKGHNILYKKDTRKIIVSQHKYKYILY